MLPFTVAAEIRAALLDYLVTTFNFSDPAVEAALLAFLQRPEGGLFKGPYLSLRLPFRKADAGEAIPLTIRPPFTPYVHQVNAFARLSAQDGHAPQPTLVTTGTGSGKTECFLYPILDDCYARRGQPGIKAIILYPMNALATDQAMRLARQIHTDERLRGQVRAGIYIGGAGQGRKGMGPDSLIEDRGSLRERPPDILLTNYKMLDFLLLRPEDRPLWVQNGPETLRFLVLDELHTYDGAQGSDVACLLRRLKSRLGSPADWLCPIGTSATVANDDEDSRQRLIDFASEVFGQPFTPDAVIGEDRLSAAEFLAPATAYTELPAASLAAQPGESYTGYLDRQMTLWFGRVLEPVALAEALAGHTFLRTLLAAVGPGVIAYEYLLARLARWDPDFGGRATADQEMLVGSFLALVAHARVDPASPAPFLTLQAQLWVREMSRLMREVAPAPGFFWRDDVPLGLERRGLPAYFCRECGHSGWVGLRYEGDDALTDDHRRIYEAYFSRSKNIRYVHPGVQGGVLPGAGERLCPACLTLTTAETCPTCRRPAFLAVASIALSEPGNNRPPQDLQCCPACGSDDALTIVGSQSASLSSVAVSHLFTSPLNTDKKLLAFTDSVQDASHRAAFFGARTYRFSLRTAMQAALPDDAALRLSDMPGQVLDYWSQRWATHPRRDQRLVASFLPPDLAGLPSYRRYLDENDGPMPPDVRGSLMKRLSWEAAAEYGFNARLGRSLEKTGSSTAYLDPERLDAVCDRLNQILPEEFAALRSLLPGALRHFVLGLVERTRVRGGIVDPLLTAYIADQGNWYRLTKRQQPLLSPFHKRSPRFPKFLTDAAQRGGVFDSFIAVRQRQTWHLDWARRTLGGRLGVDEINDIYRAVVAELVTGGVLHSYPGGQAAAYGIDPASLLVTREVTGVKCAACGHRQTAAEAVTGWIGSPCLSFECPGRYVADDSFGQHYYRALYERGHVERIFPHEHTGLLDRDTRERIEKAFRSQNRADAANLLAATPTLELGIDIGDLSATMACSVPPAPANYLQRIGRAGRKTGNSLIMTLANAKPHDLYFFEQPLEMIAGAIAPPGCFLNAPSMLQRQFLAFSMDTWTAGQPSAAALPHTVKDMLAGAGRGGFPENFLAFYEQERVGLCERFLALFAGVVSDVSADVLRSYARGDTLQDRVRQALITADAERKQLRDAYRGLRKQLEAVQADTAQYADPEAKTRQLRQEMRLLQDLVRSLEDKYILNFFTDAGLLPNYAFPETGVELRAIVTGLETDRAEDKAYSVHDYLRPASAALRELAPFNTFYAEGRKLKMTHVNLPVQGDAAEVWQFCDRCSHLELVQAHHHSPTCPVCGSTGWSDGGQQRQMVRFRRATSWNEHHASQAGDDAEERDREGYETGHFFDIRPEHSAGAHFIPSLPFGIEYLDQVTLREVNFAITPFMGQAIRIADETRPGRGFRICRGCGVVSPPAGHDTGQLHHLTNCPYTAGDGQWLDAYLYREMASEALRLLLPVSTMLTDEKLATFEACLDLGLRRKFRGDPGHLEIRSHTEPSTEGGRRLFLVIYDTVPGGTSFLKDLARPDGFREVLALALEALGGCRCRLDPEKKACYRCLYSYRSQRDLVLISRQLGVEMLSEILADWAKLQPITSLSDVHIDSLVESELEQGFINALKALADKTPGGAWAPLLHNGRLAWEMGLGERRWLIEPQVDLNATRGVAVASRADFVLWPQGPGAKDTLPVVVFTDGFAYHACPGASQGRVADDVHKRRSVVESGKFVVWTITWDDVEEFKSDAAFGLPPLFSAVQQQTLQQLLTTQNNPLPKTLARESAVSQLVAYLRRPERQRWVEYAAALGIALMAPMRPSVAAPLLEQIGQHMLTEVAVGPIGVPRDAPNGDHLYGIAQQGPLSVLSSLPQQAATPSKASQALRLVIRLEDDQGHRGEASFRRPWHQFWLLHNLWQFLSSLRATTTELIQQFGPPRLLVEGEAPAPPDPVWAEAVAFAHSDCATLLSAVRQAGWPPPLVGFELAGNDGRVVAAAELAWPDRLLAVFLTGAEPDQEPFLAAGWRAFTPDAINDILACLAA